MKKLDEKRSSKGSIKITLKKILVMAEVLVMLIELGITPSQRAEIFLPAYVQAKDSEPLDDEGTPDEEGDDEGDDESGEEGDESDGSGDEGGEEGDGSSGDEGGDDGEDGQDDGSGDEGDGSDEGDGDGGEDSDGGDVTDTDDDGENNEEGENGEENPWYYAKGNGFVKEKISEKEFEDYRINAGKTFRDPEYIPLSEWIR